MAIVVWRGLEESDIERMPNWSALIFAGAVLLVVALHVSHHGEHLIVDRDPGVYATTGLWLVDGDSQVVETEFADFGTTEGITPSTLAYPSKDAGETLFPQFPHGLPVVLSIFGWAFGDAAIFIVNPLLIGLAMMCIFAVGSRLFGPLAGASAALALGLNPAEAYFGRDTYSEILAQVLIWGGLWMLMRVWASSRAAPALLAGLVFGAALTIRLDAAALLLPLALALVLVLLSQRHRADPSLGRSTESVLFFAGGATTTAMFAVIETRLASISYYWSLESRLIDLAQATLLVAFVGGLVVAVWPRSGGLHRFFSRLRTPAAPVAAALVGAVGLFAWFVRPRVEVGQHANPSDPSRPLIEFLQRRAGSAEIDGGRNYVEQTMVWLQWYVGPLALGCALAGATLAVYLIVRRGFPRDLTLVGALVFAMSALYLRDPQITPDQIWAMRRFLPVVIPGVFLAAAGFSVLLISASGRRAASILPPLGWVLLAVVPLWQAIDVADERLREQLGMYDGVVGICDAVGDDAGIVLGRPAANLPTYAENIQINLAPALRALCDQPTVTTAAPLPPARALEIARSLEEAGRRLVVVSPTAEPFGDSPVPVGVAPVMDVTWQRVRAQVESRPHGPDTRRIRAWATPISANAGLVTAFGRDFGSPEPSAAGPRRWADGPSPRIGITLSRSGQTTVEMSLRSFVQPRNVNVLLDGKPVGSFTVQPQRFARYSASFSAPAGDHTLTLVARPGIQRISDALDVDDDRRVSVMVAEQINISTAP